MTERRCAWCGEKFEIRADLEAVRNLLDAREHDITRLTGLCELALEALEGITCAYKGVVLSEYQGRLNPTPLDGDKGYQCAIEAIQALRRGREAVL